MELIHISFAGPFQIIEDLTGKKWFFEMHHYCGPIHLKKDGDPMKNQPGGNSPFWDIVQRWIAQGKVVNNGICQWEQE